MVYPNYFATIGIPMVSGRDFGAGDLGDAAPAVCIVNESFARRFLPGEDPIGKPCYTGRRPAALNRRAGADRAVPIVGVVKDSRYSNPREKPGRSST